MKKEAVKVNELKAQERSSSFSEVVLGYFEKQALQEAQRCLQCKNPTCSQGCPVGIDIKKFIAQITQKNYEDAYNTIKEKNNFPSICGRVCPAEYQCRKACILSKKDSPFASDQAINIHFLERFVGDFAIKNELEPSLAKDRRLSKFKVAIVGSGPAGLCVAGELARSGVKVTVYEALHKTGGVLRYGIPPFRLPRNILDFEIDYLKKLGVEFVLNFIVGRTKSLEELFKEGYSAVFLGLGAGVPSFLGLDGENLCNVYSANEFLTRINLMKAYKFPQYHTPINAGKSIVVIGGGNTAIDAARAALRLQKIQAIPENTTIIYRRTETEMPARRLEIEHARQEGVNFKFLVQPVGFKGNEQGFIEKIECLECKLGKPDSSGRRRPIPQEGSNFFMESETAIIAVGLKANTLLTGVTPELKVDKYSDLVVDPKTMQTSIEGVYAGGDIVGGEGTVIEAFGTAKKAAASIKRGLI
ncbi:MAG: NADPH-dependent glutamate synthase [Candidatus Omnitrophica bacterium]|nr:NADPH-dependent glutamate synthase [Candidatus Omnitrophota bacterium]MCF7877629.1 NADPH-dependent glutamate synthase [Candidatus Omnitrophota bacterium]MCF7878978.1 NADPH-dependent glutamate synthase [Candidatus Omnitrophota bacterium]MCF7893233.1 NADPH-dependent glutamate synthase [Candidatus Omnitrophota bacterium]